MRFHKLNDLPPELTQTAHEVAASGTMQSGLSCPSCAGGRSREHSLSVIPKEAGMLLFKCWRAGCGYYATVPTGGEIDMKPPKFQPRPFTRDTEELAPAQHEFLTRYGITTGLSFVLGVVDTPHVYMPVYSPGGYERGGVMRKFGNFDGPKAVTYKTTDQPFQAWYLPECCKQVVVVEDQLSALRCWQLGYGAVALLGTNLNRAKFDEIQAVAQRIGATPLLALDRDAFTVALRYAKKYGRLSVVLLERDLKDCDNGEIMARLQA